MDEVNMSGKIVNNKLMLAHKGKLEDFCRQHNDKQVAVRVIILGNPVTSKQLAYWRNVIVPEVRLGILKMGEGMTLKQAETEILSQCPEAWVELRKKNYPAVVKQAEHLSTKELTSVIEQAKRISAMYLNHIIE